MRIVSDGSDLRPHDHDTETLLALLSESLMAQAANGRPVEIHVEYRDFGRLDDFSNKVLIALRQELAGNRDYIIIIRGGNIQLRHTPQG